MITQNTSKSQIQAWQNFLTLHGFTDVGTVDGKWGTNTEIATKEFQKSQNLNPDGKVGPDTLGAAQRLGFSSPQEGAFPPAGLLDVVFDISHHNKIVDLNKAKNAGMLALFHKATQSLRPALMRDEFYPSRKIEAKNAGLLWGAYHFGSGGSGKDQASAFLDYANPNNDTLLVLDYEPNTTENETTMTPGEAAEFVQEIFNQTGKYPGIYSGSLLSEKSNAPSYSILTHCWLWKAQYGPVVHLPPHWTDYVFWQYTDGSVGPSALPIDGVGLCDRDVFKGTADELVAFWTHHMV